MKPTIVLLAVAMLVTPALFSDDHPARDEARILANQAAVCVIMKSAIFPAEVQFQGGGYLDEDGDNVGEYGFISEMSGRTATNKIDAGALKLIQGDLAAAGDTANGYRFAVFLPDGDGAISDGDIPAPRSGGAAADVDARERSFIVYAWPATVADGDLVFMLCQDGQVRSHAYDGRAPEWRAALAPGERFGGRVAWPIFVPTAAMLAAQEAQYQHDHLDQTLVQVAVMVAEIRVVSGLWSLDCNRLALLAGGRRPKHWPKIPSTAPGFVYVRPRDPLALDQPLLVSDPALDDESRVRVVFLVGDADDGFVAKATRLDAEASKRVWAAAQEIAVRPETRANGSVPGDWDAVRDDVTAAAKAATPGH